MTVVSIVDNRTRVGSFLILVFSLCYLRAIFDIPVDTAWAEEHVTSRTLPMGLAIASIAFALIQLFQPAVKGSDMSVSSAVEGFHWRPMVLLVVLMLAYALGFHVLGFVLGTFLFLLAGFWVLGERRPLVSILVSGGLSLFMWIMLTRVFGLFLESGSLYRHLVGLR